MFNRALEMKVIKKAKDIPTDPTVPDTTFEEKTKIVGHQIDKTVIKIGAVVVVYVILDAWRQVMVAQANKD